MKTNTRDLNLVLLFFVHVVRLMSHLKTFRNFAYQRIIAIQNAIVSYNNSKIAARAFMIDLSLYYYSGNVNKYNVHISMYVVLRFSSLSSVH